MKSKPLTFAALTAVAILVTAGSAVVIDRVEHAAAGWWRRSAGPGMAVQATRFAQGVARVIAGATKS